MNKNFSRNVQWSILNIGLPSLAAILTYIFAHINSKSATIDQILLKAFSGADNLVVAAILFVVLYYEFETYDDKIHILLKAFYLCSAATCAGLFGAFKFYSMTVRPDEALNYAGAVISVVTLFSACVFALVVKSLISLNITKV
jgi:hypothetical protein